MFVWWGCQREWRVPMQLVSSELIFPSGFLPWGAGTLRLIGLIACMTEGGLRSATHSHLSCTKMAWQSEILKGARQAYPVKCAQDNVTLLFFPDFSPATTIRRKAFNLYGKAVGKQWPLSLRPDGRGLMAGKGWWQDGHESLNLSFAFSSIFSPTGILSLSIRYNNLFAGKTNTPFFFFGWD